MEVINICKSLLHFEPSTYVHIYREIETDGKFHLQLWLEALDLWGKINVLTQFSILYRNQEVLLDSWKRTSWARQGTFIIVSEPRYNNPSRHIDNLYYFLPALFLDHTNVIAKVYRYPVFQELSANWDY